MTARVDLGILIDLITFGKYFWSRIIDDANRS